MTLMMKMMRVTQPGQVVQLCLPRRSCSPGVCFLSSLARGVGSSQRLIAASATRALNCHTTIEGQSSTTSDLTRCFSSLSVSSLPLSSSSSSTNNKNNDAFDTPKSAIVLNNNPLQLSPFFQQQQQQRWMSTNTPSSSEEDKQIVSPGLDLQKIPFSPIGGRFTDADGKEMIAFRIMPRLKPHKVKKRLDRMKTYIGKEKNIRHSPWRLNLICQFVAGMTLPEALLQLDFLNKVKAPLVKKVLIRTSNLADIRDGIQPSQLEIAECFVTKGTPLKRIMYHGRGRSGQKQHQFSHMRVVLREIDFALRIYQAPTVGQKKKWYMWKLRAERDRAASKGKRDELENLKKLERKYAEEQAKKEQAAMAKENKK